MKKYNIATPVQYEKDGEQKTKWLNVGSLNVVNGKMYITLNQNPQIQYIAFEKKQETKEATAR